MAVAVAPLAPSARRQLALELAARGRRAESLALCRAELAEPTGEAWLSAQIVDAMTRADLTLAGELAAIFAAIQRGSEWHGGAADLRRLPPDDVQLSAPKLRHDLAQLRYLRDRGLGGAALDALSRGYADALAACTLPDGARAPLSAADEQRIGRAYGRLVHVADAPRLPRALSPAWDRAAVEQQYRASHPAVVVIDDFLSPAALTALRRFCLESTIWLRNRYAHGRLGSLFFTGFNCPLLLQIAEEIRDAFPALIGARYPLRQLWGFKNTCALPADSTVHADFAAVNVNFWITPTEANRDPDSGGMVIYDVDAPASWDFSKYNERSDLIRDFLAQRRARALRVPYRQNRAIVFNSDLFHATEAVDFHPDYAAHRINITMLYGDRSSDRDHPPRHVPDSLVPAWRSAAFGRRS